MSENGRQVVPNSDGGWAVRVPGAQRASAHTDTQAQAVDRAREIAIHGRDGRIRDKDTVKPGNDPFPPASQQGLKEIR